MKTRWWRVALLVKAAASMALLASVAFAANVGVIAPEISDSTAYAKTYTLLSTDAVAGSGGFAFSSAVDQGNALYFGLWLQCAGSAPAVKAEWLESPTKSADDFALGASVVSAHAGASPLVYGIAPIPMRYGRLKLSGNGGNGANTTCTAKLVVWSMRQ